MEEGAHHHAPHATGTHWLDISLALSAFFVSLVSLGLAIHNGRTMERLVAANSYPNVEFEYGNAYDLHDGRGERPAIYLSLRNTGIGPARVHSVELSFAGKPVDEPALAAGAVLHAGGGRDAAQDQLSAVRRRARRHGAGRPDLNLFAWPRPEADPRWARLEAAYQQIGARVCYCSVFDECYVRDSAQPRAEARALLSRRARALRGRLRPAPPEGGNPVSVTIRVTVLACLALAATGRPRRHAPGPDPHHGQPAGLADGGRSGRRDARRVLLQRPRPRRSHRRHLEARCGRRPTEYQGSGNDYMKAAVDRDVPPRRRPRQLAQPRGAWRQGAERRGVLRADERAAGALRGAGARAAQGARPSPGAAARGRGEPRGRGAARAWRGGDAG